MAIETCCRGTEMAGMEKGTYTLVIRLDKERNIAVGKLGRFAFPAGYYLYVGSARGGLHRRVRRHLGGEKRLHWHIDYLLEQAKVEEVWYALGDDWRECLWCQLAQGMPQAKVLAAGFGSSDCRCPSHLIYFPFSPSFQLFQRRLGKRGFMAKTASPADFLG